VKKIVAWALYDWANSAFATTVMAGFFPIFLKQYWSVGTDVTESTFRLCLAIGLPHPDWLWHGLTARQWADDLPNGHGVKILADGMQYSGDFRNGLMYGSGMIIMPDGSQVKIKWQSDPPLEKEEELPGTAVSANDETKEPDMMSALKEAESQHNQESGEVADQMEVSLQESAVSAGPISHLESGTAAETAEHDSFQVAERILVAPEEQPQTVTGRDIRIVETGQAAPDTAEATPLQELDVTAETAEHDANAISSI